MSERAGEGGERARGAGEARQWLLDLCHRHRLSPTQRRVALSFIESMPDAAFLSTSQAAVRAGVSQATVTRFAATLGFAAYADFRAALRNVILGVTSAPAAIGPDLDPVGEAHEHLATLRTTLDSPAMAAAVAALAEADVLGIVGMRASAGLAAHVGYFARRIVADVRVMSQADAVADTLAQIRLAGRGAVLVIALPRYPASTVRALRAARAAGLATVLVVDTGFVDFANDADHVLVAPVGAELVFDTHAAPMVLFTALLDGIAGRHPQRTQQRLEAHEALVASWVHGGDQPT